MEHCISGNFYSVSQGERSDKKIGIFLVDWLDLLEFTELPRVRVFTLFTYLNFLLALPSYPNSLLNSTKTKSSSHFGRVRVMHSTQWQWLTQGRNLPTVSFVWSSSLGPAWGKHGQRALSFLQLEGDRFHFSQAQQLPSRNCDKCMEERIEGTMTACIRGSKPHIKVCFPEMVTFKLSCEQ